MPCILFLPQPRIFLDSSCQSCIAECDATGLDGSPFQKALRWTMDPAMCTSPTGQATRKQGSTSLPSKRWWRTCLKKLCGEGTCSKKLDNIPLAMTAMDAAHTASIVFSQHSKLWIFLGTDQQDIPDACAVSLVHKLFVSHTESLWCSWRLCYVWIKWACNRLFIPHFPQIGTRKVCVISSSEDIIENRNSESPTETRLILCCHNNMLVFPPVLWSCKAYTMVT